MKGGRCPFLCFYAEAFGGIADEVFHIAPALFKVRIFVRL